jgi:hypothetical protein
VGLCGAAELTQRGGVSSAARAVATGDDVLQHRGAEREVVLGRISEGKVR